MKTGVRTVGVLLVMLLACQYAITGPSYAQSSHTVYLPVIRTSFSNFNGLWQGKLTQPGTTFDFQLSLSQSNDTIGGTSTIRKEDGTYAILALNGTASATGVDLTETNFIDQTTLGGWYWCVKHMTLTLSFIDGAPFLEGTWNDPGCNAGNIYLQQPNSPVVGVNGHWQGLLLQGATTFDFTLDLAQTGSTIQGTSTIKRPGADGTMSLTGIVIGRNLFLTETEITESNGTIFCLKDMQVTYQSGATGELLDGDWSGIGCGVGTLTLKR